MQGSEAGWASRDTGILSNSSLSVGVCQLTNPLLRFCICTVNFMPNFPACQALEAAKSADSQTHLLQLMHYTNTCFSLYFPAKALIIVFRIMNTS